MNAVETLPPPSPNVMKTGMPQRLDWRDQLLARTTMPIGAMVLTRSLASGLTRRADDPPDVFWGVGDRGPNIKPGDAATRYGLESLASLSTADGAKIMPLPDTGPMLARFRLVGDGIELEAVVPLRAPDGTPVCGLPPSPLPGMESEPVYALDGTRLGPSANGADTEGIAALPDGRFWIADEYGPSLLLVNSDGVVECRLVPEGAGQMFNGGAIPLREALPAIALARKHNRGFEALAVSADGSLLYVAFQSPLAHPDRAAHAVGDIVRIWALDSLTGALRCEFAYPLAAPQSFQRDAAIGPVALSDIKVSELACLPDGSLLVLERVMLSTHILRVRLHESAILPSRFSDPASRPTLEQVGQAGAARGGIPLLGKELVLTTDDLPEVCGDLEGMVVLDDGSLLLSNDSDYGIEGAHTQFWRIGLP